MDYSMYYRKNPIRIINPEQTIYERMALSHEEFRKYPAIGYYFKGNDISYEDMKNHVDNLAASLIFSGVKEGDIVPIATLNTPETPYLFYAINKIGAISKWIDIRSTEKELIEYINQNNSKVMFCFEFLIPTLEKISKETNLEKIVSISPAHSMKPLKVLLNSPREFLKMVDMAKNANKEHKVVLPENDKFISYPEYEEMGAKFSHLVNQVKFDKDRPSIILQSSATTGPAKNIVHSDLSIGHLMYDISYLDLPLFKGNTLFFVAPPWLVYGLTNSLYTAHTFGMKAQMCPEINDHMLYDHIGKFDLALTVPVQLKYLYDHGDSIPEKKLEDPAAYISGGDKIDAQLLDKLEKRYGILVRNGYGSNETGGVATICPNSREGFGTIGIPSPNTKAEIFDPETEEMIKEPHQIGEIRINTKKGFVEYYNDPEATKEIKKIDKDGLEWICTGDLAKKDEKGFLHHQGRMHRVITFKAFKILPSKLETVVKMHPNVKDCIAVGVLDEHNGQIPAMYVELKDENVSLKEVEEQLLDLYLKNLKEYEYPQLIKFGKVPYTANNKQDYRLASEMIKEENAAKKLIFE